MHPHFLHVLVFFLSADGRTDPGLSDLEQAFGLMGVSVAELEDYINNLEPVGFFHSIPQFPISKSSVLQFPTSSFDTDVRNALRGDKRDYIPEYLPPLASLHQGTHYRGDLIQIFSEYRNVSQQVREGTFLYFILIHMTAHCNSVKR